MPQNVGDASTGLQTCSKNGHVADPDRNRVSNETYMKPRIVERWVIEWLASHWQMPTSSIDTRRPLVEQGLDSMSALALGYDLEQWLGLPVDASLLWEQPTIESLAAALASPGRMPAETSRSESVSEVLPAEAAIPASAGQKRLWFLEQMHPGSPRYHVHFGLKIDGPLDVGALRRGLNEIVHRHDAFRTTFSEVEGQLTQVVAPELTLDFSVVDLRARLGEGLEHARHSAPFRRLYETQGRTPFDLARGPLIRTTLVALAADVHVLLVTQHHLITDGTSLGVFGRELVSLYRAFQSGAPSPLAAPMRQLGDVARQQERWLAGDAASRQRAWWRERLDGAPPLQLSSRRATPGQPAHGGVVAFELPAALTAAWKGLASREGATLFTAVSAAFATLLHRYSGQSDLVLGTVVANRARRELHNVVGFLANTVALRCDLAGNPTFRELLARHRVVTTEALLHQELPFDEVVRVAGERRTEGSTPLVQVACVFENVAPFDLAIPGTRCTLWSDTPDASVPGTAKFDLTLLLREDSRGLRGAFEYASDVFHQAEVERIAEHFRRLLDGIAAAPDDRIGDLPLLTERESAQLLVEWNATAADHGQDVCLHELFERQAAKTPDGLAVLFDGAQLTYAELDRRANQLARHLRGLGVGGEVRVGLCVERSLEMAVGLLGILKAGGAYVPIDPEYPRERIELMLGDAHARVLVTTRQQVLRLPVAEGTACVLIDQDGAGLATQDATRLPPLVHAGNLAYVIYTSGSTGRPKGVGLEHRSLVNLIAWQLRQARGNAAGRTLQFTSLSFDVSFQEIFATWCAGGTLVLVREDVRRDPVALLEHLDAARVERVFMPFVALAQLVDAARERGLPPTLREVVTAGEQLQITPPVRAVFDGAHAVLTNQYGPTETHVVTEHALGESPHDWPSLPPIGRPIANTQVYILDALFQPVPIGMPGELYFGGQCLARGYVGQPALTAERFVPNPFGTPGARLYRTGDRARYRADGGIEWLGRIDSQVKIRGHRVEPGEIEAVLGAWPSLRACAVVARDDARGQKRFVAYVASDGGADPRELRAYLQARLPSYMVPSAVVVLDRLPLTASGKVDRKALPAVDAEAGSERPWVQPQTPVEELVAQILACVLEHPRVGLDDDFFELGGHSLLATQVASRIRATLDVELGVRAVFEHPTVRGLARLVTGRTQRAEDGPRRSVGDRSAREPLSFGQERLWFLAQLEPQSCAYNMPFAARLTGELDLERLRRAFEGVVNRHEVLRTTFPSIDGRPMQVVAPAGPWPLPVIDLESLSRGAQQAESRQRQQAEAQTPFRVDRGPLLRTTLLRLSPREHLLLVTMHHLVSDGGSLGVLVRELRALYSGDELEQLPLQYRDYAAWQRESLQGARLEAQLDYWRKRLTGASPLDLPVDRPRPATRSHRGAVHLFQVDGETAAGLRALAREQGVTMFMLLLTVFKVLLQRYTGSADICVGTPIANRTHRETEELVGFFVNTLVLRTELGHRDTFAELLGRVRHVALGAYSNQDVPFEKVVEALEVERDLSRTPLFQVMFALQNTPMAALALDGVEVDIGEQAIPEAKFELSLSLLETEGGLSATVEYCADLFDTATIERLAGHYRVLLGAVLANPHEEVVRLPLLTADEQHRIVAAWNDTRTRHPVEASALRRFEDCARQAPDAVALRFGADRVTYGELNRRASRVAQGLRDRGVGPEEVVGVCIERGPEMVVALLAVWKAGAPYLPLDPDNPSQRLEMMIDDAGCRWVLTQASLEDRLPEAVARLRVGELSTPARTPAASDLSVAPEVQVDGQALAYVLFTSGSTGRPKGVMVCHDALGNLLSAMARRVRANPDDVFLAVTTIGFDIAGLELWLPLTTGGQVELVSRDTARDGAALRARIEAGCTVVQATPGGWRMLLEAGWEGSSTLRALCGGEALPPMLGRELHLRTAAAWNVYGPTETTIWSTFQQLGGGDDTTIGRPLDNTETYILDEHAELVPVGVAGELYIGGVGVARGYIGRPELTADRFVPNPFGTGTRLYRTGDLARYRSDGRIEFLGRRDHQVKIRGHRIELGEVEAALALHPDVQACVVDGRADPSGDKRLVAYVVVDPASTAMEPALRRHLQGMLPDHMVPAAFVKLEALPLNASGKVDRGALPPVEAEPRFGPTQLLPRTRLELRLAQIWEELLGVRPIGVRDGFFEIGGHSLLAIRLTAAIEKQLGRVLPVASLFRLTTIEAQALTLGEGSAGGAASALVPLNPHGTRPRLFCVHPAGGTVFCYHGLSRHLGSDQPFFGLQARGVEPGEEPHGSIDAMARHYADAISGLQPGGPYHLGGWSLGGLVAFETACRLAAAGHEVTVTLIDTYGPAFGARRGAAAGDDFWFLAYLAKEIELAVSADELRALGMDGALDRVGELASEAGLFPPGVGVGYVRRLYAVNRANRDAARGYSPSLFPGAVTLVRARDRHPDANVPTEPFYGWDSFVSGTLREYEVPGTHSSLLREPHVQEVAAVLREVIGGG